MTRRQGRASIAAKLVMAALCLLWLIPTAGIVITSLRTPDGVNSSGWWTVLRLPLDLSQLSAASYRQALNGGMAASFLNSLAVTLPAVAIAVVTAGTAAYAFTFSSSPAATCWSADRGAADRTQPGGPGPAAAHLRRPPADRDLRGRLPDPHRLRHAPGRVHLPRLHADPAHLGHRVGQGRRGQPLPDLLAAGRPPGQSRPWPRSPSSSFCWSGTTR